MKHALILHGTDSSPKDNWFPWLKTQLETQGYQVWVPELPGASHPNAARYNEFLLANPNFTINNQTIIIGHSSGAVEILALLQTLPEPTRIKLAVLVGSFTEKLAEQPEWHDELIGLFEQPFDFAGLKRRADKLIFVHSDNDPYCPLDQAKFLAEHTGGQLVVLPGKQHFSAELKPSITEVPEILDLIKANV